MQQWNEVEMRSNEVCARPDDETPTPSGHRRIWTPDQRERSHPSWSCRVINTKTCGYQESHCSSSHNASGHFRRSKEGKSGQVYKLFSQNVVKISADVLSPVSDQYVTLCCLETEQSLSEWLNMLHCFLYKAVDVNLNSWIAPRCRSRTSGGTNNWTLIRFCSDLETFADRRRDQRWGFFLTCGIKKVISLPSCWSAWLQQWPTVRWFCSVLFWWLELEGKWTLLHEGNVTDRRQRTRTRTRVSAESTPKPVLSSFMANVQ